MHTRRVTDFFAPGATGTPWLRGASRVDLRVDSADRGDFLKKPQLH